MFAVNFYTFSKRENSTKLPTGINSTTYNCLLKDSCSIKNPVLILHDDDISVGTGTTMWNPSAFNYAYIADFQRYYFVRDWVWNKPFWECYLTVDVLASFRSNILENTKYVLRSASDYNQDAFDDAYVPTSTMQLVQSSATFPYYVTDTNNGYVVLGIAGLPAISVGSREKINYYAINNDGLTEFYEYLYTNILNMDWQSTSDWNAVISKAIVDPFDYIVSAYYVPLNLDVANFPDQITPSSSVIKFGFWAYTLQESTSWVNNVKDRVITLDNDLVTPIYPYTSADGITGLRYEKLSPYSEYFVDLGAGGIHKLNGMLVMRYGGIHVETKIDLGTGVAVYNISPYGGTNKQLKFMTASAQFCPPIPIGRQKNDILGMISAGANIATAPLSGAVHGIGGGPIGAVAGGIAGGLTAVIGAGAQALASNAMAISGSIGSKAAMTEKISLNAQYTLPQKENSAEIGYVLCEDRLLSGLSGYTLCADGCIVPGTLAGTQYQMYDDERRDIGRYLTEGFYIE